MTDTIDSLKAELEELKKARAEADLRKELEELKADAGGPTPTMTDLKVAAVRQVICGFSHGLFGPVSSIYYGARTGHWLPTLAATGVAVLTVPLALVDFGLTFAIAPPVTSAALLITKSQENRRKLNISLPEEAEAKMAKFRYC